jgi:glycosyltransferase involved in cell wall biosynthesis
MLKSILIVNRHLSQTVGGSETQCHLIANYLVQQGLQVIYYGIGITPQNQSQDTYTKYLYPWNPLKFIYILFKHKSEVIYWRLNKRHFLIAILVSKIFRRRVVFAVSHINDVTPWVFRGKKTTRSYLNSLIERLNFIGFYGVDLLISLVPDFLGYAPVKQQVYIPNIAYTDHAEFHWRRPYVCWISNIKSAKRPELFIALAKECLDLNVDFLMAGEIQDQNLNVLIKDTSLTNFHYLGAIDPKLANGVISDSLCLAHTCLPEGFPNVFLQAWAMKKRVVSFEYDPGGLIHKLSPEDVCHSDWSTFLARVRKIIISREKLPADFYHKIETNLYNNQHPHALLLNALKRVAST